MDVLEMPDKMKTRKEREKVFEELYESSFPSVAKFVSKMKGSLQDAKDIFHDALVIYYEKSLDPELVITTTPEAYILGIAKHLWIRKFNRDHCSVSLDSVEAGISIPEDYYPSPDSQRLLRFVEQTGKKCLDLLRAFYYEKLAMKDIMRVLGFQNEHSATVQKFKCLEKVRNTVKEKSIGYDYFTE